MDTEKKKQIIKLCVAISIVVIILLLVGIAMIKYEVEGDKNMPFNLSKIVVVSGAEGGENQEEGAWNFNVYQNNDIYFFIDKNNDYTGKDTSIDKISIENVNIIEQPKQGEIKAYMPSSVGERLYNYSEEYIVEDKLEYRGAVKSNSQTLEIGKQGGNVLIRFCNTGIGRYSSKEDKEIVHDGTLLKKINLIEEDVKFKVSFDFVIEVSKHQYRANIVLELPCGDILEEGTSSIEKTDMSDIIFKRQ